MPISRRGGGIHRANWDQQGSQEDHSIETKPDCGPVEEVAALKLSATLSAKAAVLVGICGFDASCLNEQF
jgi:hypothetical protein